MSAIIQGYQLRTAQFGTQVIKGPITPPNSGSSATIATVAGGAVLITSMLGLVTTVMSGTTGQVAIGTVPSTGTASTSAIASAAVIGGREVGTWIVPLVSAGIAGSLVIGANAGAALFLPTPFIVSAGTINWTTSVATMTGQVKWYFTYVALDNGAGLS
jgi:hypothetical protein